MLFSILRDQDSEPLGGLMRTVAGLVIFCVLLAGCTSNDGDSRKRECERLRDHLVDLRVAQANVDEAAHREAMIKALGESFASSCEALSQRERDCAFKATDAAAAAACSASSR
ncbi:MAG: hypothetical protein AB7P03_00015 [Kofleriaceae bacterium]